MSILEVAQRYGSYKEVAPGEYAGPCPKCRGAMRFRIFPEKDEGKCRSCDFTLTHEPEQTEAPPPAAAAPVVYIIRASDGREVNITDDPAEYQRLVGAGKVVFDSREIAYVKASGATKEQALRILNIKEFDHGAKITDVELMEKADG